MFLETELSSFSMNSIRPNELVFPITRLIFHTTPRVSQYFTPQTRLHHFALNLRLWNNDALDPNTTDKDFSKNAFRDNTSLWYADILMKGDRNARVSLRLKVLLTMGWKGVDYSWEMVLYLTYLNLDRAWADRDFYLRGKILGKITVSIRATWLFSWKIMENCMLVQIK